MKEVFPTRQNSGMADRVDVDKFKLRSIRMGSVSVTGARDPILFSAIVGIDTPVRAMGMDAIRNLGDEFTRFVLLQGKQPLTLDQLVHDIEEADGGKFRIRKMFLVAEGGQHNLTTPAFDLNARIVFTWQTDNASSPLIFLSTVPVTDSTTSLLQLISWSNVDGAFHFFERKHGIWGWAGNSFTSFDPRARGNGPFDSHINGGLVMKELEFPWGHWHSMSNSIPREVFAGTEFNRHPYFSTISNAEVLETIVKNGVRAWTKSRIATHSRTGRIENFKNYFQQIVTATSVNLTSSSVEFARAQHTNIAIPTSFFLDSDIIEFACAKIDAFADVIPPDRITLNGGKYKQLVSELTLAVTSENPAIRIFGDTHFSFFVPERAFEDREVCRQLVNNNIISARLVLALTLVDFPNPVDSPRRRKMLDYCPDAVTLGSNGFPLDQVFIQNISTGMHAPGSPEAEFLAYWGAPDIVAVAKAEIATFSKNIQQQVSNESYMRQLILLAEFRKEEFRKRKLAEFASTLSKVESTISKFVMAKNGEIL